MASFNICGTTLHSALQLTVHRTDLQGAALQRLQLRLARKHYVIIDEMSMIGQRMLAWVDHRLRQASGRLDSPLGGYSVILFGDFGPVADRLSLLVVIMSYLTRSTRYLTLLLF